MGFAGRGGGMTTHGREAIDSRPSLNEQMICFDLSGFHAAHFSGRQAEGINSALLEGFPMHKAVINSLELQKRPKYLSPHGCDGFYVHFPEKKSQESICVS